MAYVLVIDDLPQIRRLIGMVLASRGHRVVEAADGVEGWRLMRERRPDLVVLDVMMPGPSGIDVCRAMRSDLGLRAVPIVILSADGLHETQLAALAVGVTAFMTKPFSPSAFMDTIGRLIGASGDSHASV